MLFVRPAPPTRHTWSAEEETVRRRLRLLVGVFTGLIWVDNLTEHYRGGFRRRLMWVPVVANPAVAAVAVASALSRRPQWRRLFLAASGAQVVISVVGFVEHQRGIKRQPGRGRHAYLYNAWYGPPVAAPLQYLGFGILGLVATLPHRALAPLLRVLTLRRLLRLYTALNVPPTWGEIAYLHARGSFQDPFQWLPVVALPAAGAASAAAVANDEGPAATAHRAGARAVVGLGMVGTVFHMVGLDRRYHGLDRRSLVFNWLSGPPVPAPLQLIGLGLAALVAEGERRRS